MLSNKNNVTFHHVSLLVTAFPNFLMVCLSWAPHTQWCAVGVDPVGVEGTQATAATEATASATFSRLSFLPDLLTPQ